MKAKELLLIQLKDVLGILEGTMSDINIDYLHTDPGGKAGTIAAAYGHIIWAQDWAINSFLQKKPLLSETEFKNKTGFSIAYPSMDERDKTEAWMKNVHIDLDQVKVYAKAVAKNAEDYFLSLTDEDLDKKITTQMMGDISIGFILTAFVIGHTYTHTGEIAVLKGLHGAKGYPF